MILARIETEKGWNNAINDLQAGKPPMLLTLTLTKSLRRRLEALDPMRDSNTGLKAQLVA